jgi:hypothetical protein
MLHVFYLDVAKVDFVLHMLQLQVYITNVSTISEVVSVLSGCCIYCSGYTHMLHKYIPNVSHVSGVCCSKCFLFQVFSLASTGSAAEGGPACMRTSMRSGSMHT